MFESLSKDGDTDQLPAIKDHIKGMSAGRKNDEGERKQNLEKYDQTRSGLDVTSPEWNPAVSIEFDSLSRVWARSGLRVSDPEWNPVAIDTLVTCGPCRNQLGSFPVFL